MGSLSISDALQLAKQHHSAGRLAAAGQIYQVILQNEPNHAEVLHLLGVLMHQHGDHPSAADLITRSIAINPSAAHSYSDLGLVLIALGRTAEAIASLQKAIQLNSALPDAYCNLGLALLRENRLDESIHASCRAIALRPRFAQALHNLGFALAAQEKYDEAVAAYNSAIEASPSFADAWTNLAKAYYDQGRFPQAIAAAGRALSIKPNDAEAHLVQGNTLREMGRFSEAIAALRHAVALNPSSPHPLEVLGVVYCEIGETDLAVGACEKAIDLAPHRARPHSVLGSTLLEAGRSSEAIAHFEQGLALDPTSAEIHGNLIYSSYFDPARCDLQSISTLHADWNRVHAAPLLDRSRALANVPDLDRRLRIGFVSPDFCNHCQSLFTIPLLRNLDRGQFDPICFSNTRRNDEITEILRPLFSQWHPITHLSDENAADLIRENQIDILIDLTQHMAGNRLLIFARKPAPVQVAWLGYPGSSGLEAMDYRLSDPHLDPPGLFDRFYSEKTIRLPDTFWCYDPQVSGIEVGPLPAMSNGFITFGCLNNFAKINDQVIDQFAAVLRAIPSSRLQLLAKSGSHRALTLRRFEQLGISPGRVQFLDRRPRADYLKLYQHIDLSLDTLPYNGHTTSLDSIWMGVPVITQVGATPVGRAGLSILTNLEMPEFIASNSDQFVEIASRFSQDLPRLSSLRTQLRQRMEESPLMDASKFAKDFQAAIREMWRSGRAEG